MTQWPTPVRSRGKNASTMPPDRYTPDVLSELAHPGPGVGCAPLDLEAQAATRARFPALTHRRLRGAAPAVAPRD